MIKPPQSYSNRRSPTRRSARQRRSPTATLKAELAAAQSQLTGATERIAALEARLGITQDADAPVSRARLNTLLAIIEALLVTHESAVIRQLVVDEAPRLFPG